MVKSQLQFLNLVNPAVDRLIPANPLMMSIFLMAECNRAIGFVILRAA